MYITTLSERLNKILDERHESVGNFAEKIGVTKRYVTSLLSDNGKSISRPTARLIGKTYGYSSQWILGLSDEPQSTAEQLTDLVSSLNDDEGRKVKSFITDILRNGCLNKETE